MSFTKKVMWIFLAVILLVTPLAYGQQTDQAGAALREGRGLLKPGYFADITIFDPATIIDHATFVKPDQLSEGIDFTIVNGQVEYDHGKPTGATAGKVLRGRGWRPGQDDMRQ